MTESKFQIGDLISLGRSKGIIIKIKRDSDKSGFVTVINEQDHLYKLLWLTEIKEYLKDNWFIPNKFRKIA